MKKQLKSNWNCSILIKKQIETKRIFAQTPSSHSTLKSEWKKFTPQNQSLFALLSDKNHYSNLTSKVMKMSELTLKKTAPQYKIKFFDL